MVMANTSRLKLQLLLAALYCSLRSNALKAEQRENDNRALCECGTTSKTLDVRVVGGHDAIRGQFPYATALVSSFFLSFSRDAHDLIPFCGATLVTDRHVVTAAHCVRGRSETDIGLDISDYDVHSGEYSRKRLRRAVSLVMHPEHKKEGFRNDIAVIEFDEPITLGPFVRTAWLPPQGYELTPDTMVTVIGWGRLQYQGRSPDILQALEIPIMDYEDCQQMFTTDITPYMMICAGGEEGRDSCIGDSGGGLFSRLGNEYVLSGVVSFGKKCALPHVPGIYGNVSTYVDWIYQQTVNADCQPCIASMESLQ